MRDLNNNGNIDNGHELFGSETLLLNGQQAANGYLALAELDSNADKKIDSNDTNYSTLKIWKDANSDGKSSADELFDLATLGIQSSAVDYIGNSAFQMDKTYSVATEALPDRHQAIYWRITYQSSRLFL